MFKDCGRTIFFRSKFEKSSFEYTDFRWAKFFGGDFQNTEFGITDLTGVEMKNPVNLNQDQLDSSYYIEGSPTVLPKELKPGKMHPIKDDMDDEIPF